MFYPGMKFSAFFKKNLEGDDHDTHILELLLTRGTPECSTKADDNA